MTLFEMMKGFVENERRINAKYNLQYTKEERRKMEIGCALLLASAGIMMFVLIAIVE